jgi:hypothetical protein
MTDTETIMNRRLFDALVRMVPPYVVRWEGQETYPRYIAVMENGEEVGRIVRERNW